MLYSNKAKPEKTMMDNNKKILALFFFCLFFIIASLSANDVLAAGLVPCGDTADDPCTIDDFIELIGNVLSYIWIILVPALGLLWFGFAGYKMMLSQGDPGKFNEGKNMLLYGTIGIIVVYTAPLLIKSFLSLIGADDWVFFFFGSDTDSSFSNIGELLDTIRDNLLTIIGGLCTLVIVIGGAIYMTAKEDANQAKMGLATVKYALIGLVIVLISAALMSFISMQ